MSTRELWTGYSSKEHGGYRYVAVSEASFAMLLLLAEPVVQYNDFVTFFKRPPFGDTDYNPDRYRLIAQMLDAEPAIGPAIVERKKE